jgi:uracil-DNA glycosylase family 4
MNSLENLLDSFQKEDDDDIFRPDIGTEKIVFIHDSYEKRYGKVYEFSDDEYSILSTLLKKSVIPRDSYQFVASVKDFNVSEDDLTTADINRHRKFLEEDLETISPDLVIPLGNLAFKTLTKKSGITSKRGKEFHIELGSGRVIPVVPTLHPFSLYAEPKLRSLFLQDVNNAYTKFILKENKFDGSPYKLINGDIAEFDELMDSVMESDAVAFDVETGGLDFKKDKLFTIGFSVAEKNAFVVAINHRESEWSPKDLAHIKDRISFLMSKNDTVKIAHNLKFDYKFLRNWGISSFNNMEDTQIIHSLVDENLPHGLMDLVKQYFPKELEKF